MIHVSAALKNMGEWILIESLDLIKTLYLPGSCPKKPFWNEYIVTNLQEAMLVANWAKTPQPQGYFVGQTQS